MEIKMDAPKVKSWEYELAYDEMLEQNGYARDIQILNNYRELDGAVSMGVNWSAKGTMTSAEAIEFGERLIAAAKLAEGFKFNGCKIDYRDEEC